jgi:hypothetical protein
VLPVVLADEDDGVDGLVTTIDKPFSRVGHVDGSFDEAVEWNLVGEGGRVAVTLMGVHDAGPVVILQRTPPGQVATPAVTFGSDVFRCVISGSAHAAGQTQEMGDTAALPDGHRWPQAVAGPHGLDEVIIIGDRRGATSLAPDDHAGWTDTLNGLISRLSSRLPAAA